MWYWKTVNRSMIVKGEEKYIVRFYKPSLFSRYIFAEDNEGVCWDIKNCKKIKKKRRKLKHGRGNTI